MEEVMGVEWMDRLSVAVAALEAMVGQGAEAMQASGEEAVGPIVATVASEREAELAEKLMDAERTIAELRAQAAGEREQSGGRKTVAVAAMQAKGFGAERVEAEAVDGALGSLSLEQRIAVKSEMLRAGLLR